MSWLTANAAASVLAVIVATWLLFYIDRIPVASLMTENVVARSGNSMIISGVAAGPLMSINFRSAGRVRLDASANTRIEQPGEAALAALPLTYFGGRPPPGRVVIDVYKAASGNAGIDFELRTPAGTSGAIVLEPVEAVAGRKRFRISAHGGNLAVHALMIPGGDGRSAGEMMLLTSRGATALDEVSLLLPSGVALDVIADDPEIAVHEPIVLDLPVKAGDEAVRTLAAGAVATGEAAAGRFDTLVCGAGPDRHAVLWPPIFPRLTLKTCAAGALTLRMLEPFKGMSAHVYGRAFHVRDGKTAMWDAPKIFTSSPIGGKLLDALIIGPVLAWAGLALRALWKALRRRV